jgi:isopenicillin N synthase-like dioxygenase
VSLAVLRPGDVTVSAVEVAFADSGGFLLLDPTAVAQAQKLVSVARRFFDLPIEIKRELAIEHSPHFRGWSEMRNERDWREQIHLGSEQESNEREPLYLLLQGPNLWPADPAFRTIVTRYIEVVAAAGEHVLATIAGGLGFRSDVFGAIARNGYHLLKLICYWAQQEPQAPRPGVAPHVDFSYLTLTLQERPGLEVRRPDGNWMEIEPVSGAWWVHPGELLEFATSGLYAATPHRVLNRSHDRARLSMPFFVNPPLSAIVPRLRAAWCGQPQSTEHVHHVLRCNAHAEPFVFGEAEWRRKGLNRWCVDCVQQ